MLRPYQADDVDRFAAEFSTEEGVTSTQWFGFTAGLPAAKIEFAETGFLTPDWGRLVVEADAEWAGRVAWWKHQWGPAESWCWQFGILIREAVRGRGVGTSAQRLLAEYLFAHTRAHRIEAYTDISNAAEQRALEKAAFTREGIIRACQWRGGMWHDQVMYSRLRDDLAAVTTDRSEEPGRNPRPS